MLNFKRLWRYGVWMAFTSCLPSFRKFQFLRLIDLRGPASITVTIFVEFGPSIAKIYGNLPIFMLLAVAILDLQKFEILTLGRQSQANGPCQISSKNGRTVLKISCRNGFWERSPYTILDFQKFVILTVARLYGASMYHLVKFRKNQPNNCGDITI